MPGIEDRIEKRKEKLRDMISMLGKSDQAGAFQDLSDKITEYQEAGTKLGLEEIDALAALYQRCGVYMKQEHDKAKQANSGNAEMYMKMMRKMAKDYKALFRYRKQLTDLQKKDPEAAEKKKLDITRFYEVTRTRTVTLNGKSLSELGKSGAGLSVRYKMPVALQNEPVKDLQKGDIVMGFFTEDVRPDRNLSDAQNRENEEKRIADETMKKYPLLAKYFESSDLVDLFSKIETLDKEWLDEIRLKPGLALFKQGTDGMLTKFKDLLEYLEPREEELEEQLKAVTGHAKLSKEEKKLPPDQQEAIEAERKYEKETMVRGLVDFASNLYKSHFSERMREKDGIDHSAAVGQRNALMSDIADLLGCGDVVAFSEKMNIKTIENGRTVTKKGVFMLPGEGVDPTNGSYGTFMPELNKTMIENSKGLNQKIAALQLLDHICGNTDRHNCNYFLQCKNGKVTGIQGIDNDQSFGADQDVERHGYSTRFEDMRIIPKSMADAVGKLSSETLEVIMQGYDLNAEEIKNTVERFERLKDKLRKAREFYKGAVPGYLDPKMPRIVEDDRMDEYSTCEQLTANKDNIFGKVADGTSTGSSLFRFIKNDNEKIVEAANEFKKAFMESGKGSIRDNVRKMKELGASEPKKKKLTSEEKKKKNAFDKMVKETEALLKSKDVRGGIIKDPKKSFNMFSGDRIAQFGSELDEVLVTMRKKNGKENGNIIEPENEEVSEYQFLDTEKIVKNGAYKAIDKALEASYECLDALFDVADQYQSLQAELAMAKGDEKETLTAEIVKLKETPDFKKYMAAVENRDKLSAELERYVEVQRMTHDMNYARDRFDYVTHKKPELADPYKGSNMQMESQRKVADAGQRQAQMSKQGEKKAEGKGMHMS